jgi:phosphoglycerol transferase MdoB-like AlkP superfamily enzyme
MLKIFASIYHQSKLSQWLNMLSVSFVLITIVRVVEWSLILSDHSISGSLYLWELSGFFHDYFTTIVLLCSVGVLFGLLSFLNVKLARFFSLSILLTFLLFHFLLVLYFMESLTPLSVSDIYGMSQSQVKFISQIYDFKFIYLFGLIPLVLLVIFVFNLISIVLNFKVVKYITIVILSLSIGKQVLLPVNEKAFESQLNYHIVSNKLYYFVASWFTYQNDKLANSDQYVPASEYPFYNDSEVKDVLSPFFNSSETPPNVVFIISESLGKQYSGKDARLGSFTPFLDSLAEHSLYWQNVVANAERTFGAIPNLMAGLPEGERGFMNLLWNMPDHLSLPLLLKEQNNYQTAFYCGAWKHFDNMADYVMFQKFDHVLGEKDFKPNLIDHIDIPGEKEFDMQNWGAEDYEVFKQSVEFMTQNFDTLRPFFNMYLSTSFHKPYAYTDQPKFDNEALSIIKSKVAPSKQDEYIKHLTDFGAILYADYSMEQVFEMYKEAGLFENTVFIICGDHSLKFMNDNPRLDKFHIPVLIYSPLLNRSKSMKSVVSQKDFPSALQALLKNKFKLKLPSFSISQSNKLDTLVDLSFDNEFVMMSTNKRITNYVENDLLLSDNMLFKLGHNLSIESIEDENKLKDLQSKLMVYKSNSNYVCSKNRLVPQSIIEEYSPIVYQLQYVNDFNFMKSGSFKKYEFTKSDYFSKPQAIEVKNNQYVQLLNDQVVDLSTRVRVVVKFKMYSPTGYIPNLVIATGNNELKDKVFYLSGNSDYFESTEKEGWNSVEVAYWIEKGKTDSIDVYLFNAKKVSLFLDDIDIEIRNF